MLGELLLGMVLGFIVAFALFMICFLSGTFQVFQKEVESKPQFTLFKKQQASKRKPKVHDDYNAWLAEQKDERERG